jgi:diguanylate cyclase (GGDEF)-like protein
VVGQLRERGFRVEMDDFGTGYSSLNMISSLPIDALKLDMQFVRQAFRGEKDTRMIGVIIDIADHLSVPVIAEGVETEEQLNMLRDLGCDIVQGYYFSKPVPAEEFVPFLTNALEQRRAAHEAEEAVEAEENAEPEEAEEIEEAEAPVPREKRGMPLRSISSLFAVLAFLAALVLFISDAMIERSYAAVDAASVRYATARDVAESLRTASDYLTDEARAFVVTEDPAHALAYFEEVNVTRRRDAAVATLEELLPESDREIHQEIQNALALSNELKEIELEAMRLAQTAAGLPDAAMPPEVAATALPPEDAALPPAEARARALALMYDERYASYKEQIWAAVEKCAGGMVEESSRQLAEAEAGMAKLLRVQTGSTVLFLLLALLMTLFITRSVRIPLTRLMEKMCAGQPAELSGASELRFVAGTYNQVLAETQKKHQKLTYEASHDALTGLYNRSAYEMFMESIDLRNIALLIVDVDSFKQINDTYGHDVGDRVLQRVADILRSSFRSVDILCRVGGDEFVVIMTRANSSLKTLVANKIAHANELLQNPKDGLPRASLSVGVAFADRKDPQGDIFKDADTALYRVKNAGRAGCGFYE